VLPKKKRKLNYVYDYYILLRNGISAFSGLAELTDLPQAGS
jgi:hypothetical protein